MENRDKHLANLSEIRSLMEQSSRFISLSGLSGIAAGCFALLGALGAYMYLGISALTPYDLATRSIPEHKWGLNYIEFFALDFGLVLCLALLFGFIFTNRKARKAGLKIWDATSRRLVINLFIPLVAGGIFCLILLYHGYWALIAPCTLIFYGLSLINAGKYTLRDIKYLGISETILGLIASFFIGYGLLFWSIGFGVLHIVYGTLMYLKYER